jgi:signal transduction histidine kinase
MATAVERRSSVSSMPQWDWPRLRVERLVGAGRIILAVFSLFAVWLDPTEPAYHADVAYALLTVYVVYAAVVAAFVLRISRVPRWWPLVTHAADLSLFALVIFFTAGPGSPFTAYFVFTLICATLRWQWRGTLWTAVVALGVFFSVSAYYGVVARDPGFDVLPFVIRGTYLFVIAVLLGYVGVHTERILRETRLLASWPHTTPPDVESLARDLVGYAEVLLEAPRAALVWREPDALRWRLVLWDRGASTSERHPADSALVADAVVDRAFILHADWRARTLVQEAGHLRLVEWDGEPLAPWLAARLAARTVLSVPLGGESFEGRLFVLDKTDVTLDDLVMAEVMGGVIAARLDAWYLSEQLRHAAATEERIRLARDLHDSVLQSFTGIGLRLAAVREILGGERSAGIEALEGAQRVLAAEQRELRFFIDELKPRVSMTEAAALSDRLTELAERIEREWDLSVQLKVEPPETLTPSLGRELYHLIREALVNAAQHGAASAACVCVGPAGSDGLAVSIADNGRGFAFQGRYTSEELARQDLGPKTIQERVLALHGTLTVESGATGASLHLRLPMGT